MIGKKSKGVYFQKEEKYLLGYLIKSSADYFSE